MIYLAGIVETRWTVTNRLSSHIIGMKSEESCGIMLVSYAQIKDFAEQKDAFNYFWTKSKNIIGISQLLRIPLS